MVARLLRFHQPGRLGSVPSCFSQKAPGQTWRLTGYLFVWENAKVIGVRTHTGKRSLYSLIPAVTLTETVGSPRYGTDANLPGQYLGAI